MTNLQKAKTLESDYYGQILKLIEKFGQNELSRYLYENDSKLQARLDRAKSSSPYKLISYLKILEDYEKARAGKKEKAF